MLTLRTSRGSSHMINIYRGVLIWHRKAVDKRAGLFCDSSGKLLNFVYVKIFISYNSLKNYEGTIINIVIICTTKN